MNIFEDLIDELKQENLLEETVTEKFRANNAESETSNDDGLQEVSPTEISLESSGEFVQTSADEALLLADNLVFTPSEPTTNQAEFFRKRAVEEVSGLQMVEHIFSGVERQQKKLMPKVYDDLNVKKALHAFLQISGDTNAPEHAQAEFQLMQETESWYSALSHRDKQISVAHLRRYCETIKPVLSAQALVALAKFYRNSPYSEAVRSKFDLIVTRLFSREAGSEKREIAFQTNDLMRHLSELYAEWESVSVYSSGDEADESELLLVAFKFEEFMGEAEAAENFDELIRNDFFNRLRNFKQGTHERFFAPLVTATAIESNVRVGNRYIELLEREKAKGELDKLENKYGFLHDQVISDATSKTLQLVELLKNNNGQSEEQFEEEATENSETSAVKNAQKASSEVAKNTPSRVESGFFAVNKWLLAGSAVAIVLSIVIYFWSSNIESPMKLSQDVKSVSLDNSSLNEFVRDARIGNRTFFAVVKPSWDGLNGEKKEEVLKKIIAVGGERDFNRVHLLKADGKTAGSVAEGVVEVNN